MNEQELAKLKKDIENKRTEKARLEGQLDEMKRRLKTEFNVETVEEAKTYIKELSAKVDKLDEQLEEGMEELRKEFGGD